MLREINRDMLSSLNLNLGKRTPIMILFSPLLVEGRFFVRDQTVVSYHGVMSEAKRNRKE